MSLPILFQNSDCERCHKVRRDMVRVGAVIFCHSCFIVTFTTKDPVREEREKYLVWLRKMQARLDTEYSTESQA